jgi:hypothetical protein
MEIIYMGERSLKATKSEGMPNSPENKYAPKVLKREESLKTVKIEENDSHALFTERPKSGSLSPPAIKKSAKVTHDSKHRSRYSSAPLILSNQDPWYARRSLSPENSFSPYSSNSVAYGSLYKSPSPPAPYYAMPYMQPAVSSFNTNSQDPFYAAYYDPTRQTFIYSSNYINQSYAQPLHPNISNSSNIFFPNHSAPQYTTPSAAYHASMNYVHRRPSYSTPVSPAAYEYEKACNGCIDPCLLGMP